MKTYYNQELSKWLRNPPGRAATQYQINQLFGLAYGKAASCNNAIKGIRKAGIYPLSRDVFEEVDFLPSEVSDRPIGESGKTLNFCRNEVASTAASLAPLTAVSSALLSPSPNFAFSATPTLFIPGFQFYSIDFNISCYSTPYCSPCFTTVCIACSINYLMFGIIPPQSTTSCSVSLAPASASSNDSMCTASLSSVALHNSSSTNFEIPYVSVNEISLLPRKDFLAGKKKRKTAKPTLLTESPHKKLVQRCKTKATVTLKKAHAKSKAFTKKQKKKSTFYQTFHICSRLYYLQFAWFVGTQTMKTECNVAHVKSRCMKNVQTLQIPDFTIVTYVLLMETMKFSSQKL